MLSLLRIVSLLTFTLNWPYILRESVSPLTFLTAAELEPACAECALSPFANESPGPRARSLARSVVFAPLLDRDHEGADAEGGRAAAAAEEVPPAGRQRPPQRVSSKAAKGVLATLMRWLKRKPRVIMRFDKQVRGCCSSASSALRERGKEGTFRKECISFIIDAASIAAKLGLPGAKYLVRGRLCERVDCSCHELGGRSPQRSRGTRSESD
jgi:hypothetical protein